DLPEMPAQGAGAPLRVSRGAGGRPGTLVERHADRRSFSGASGTGGEVGEAPPGGHGTPGHGVAADCRRLSTRDVEMARGPGQRAEGHGRAAACRDITVYQSRRPGP